MLNIENEGSLKILYLENFPIYGIYCPITVILHFLPAVISWVYQAGGWIEFLNESKTLLFLLVVTVSDSDISSLTLKCERFLQMWPVGMVTYDMILVQFWWNLCPIMMITALFWFHLYFLCFLSMTTLAQFIGILWNISSVLTTHYYAIRS